VPSVLVDFPPTSPCVAWHNGYGQSVTRPPPLSAVCLWRVGLWVCVLGGGGAGLRVMPLLTQCWDESDRVASAVAVAVTLLSSDIMEGGWMGGGYYGVHLGRILTAARLPTTLALRAVQTHCDGNRLAQQLLLMLLRLLPDGRLWLLACSVCLDCCDAACALCLFCTRICSHPFGSVNLLQSKDV
jgi:hypothetical protein